MEKFILIDTWNGEGYSDSKAEIIEARSFHEAMGIAHEIVHTKECDRVEAGMPMGTWDYTVNDDDGNPVDNGAIRVIPYNGEYGILIMPDGNDYRLLVTKEEYDKELASEVSNNPEHEEVNEMENSEGCFHNDNGCMIFQKFNIESERLVRVTITAKVTARVLLEEGETEEQFKKRYVDIYLNSAGEHGFMNKQDLGADEYEIKVESEPSTVPSPSTNTGRIRVVFEGSEEQIENLRLLMESGDNDLPVIINI